MKTIKTLDKLQDNQFYFFRPKPTGVYRDWQVGHAVFEDNQCQIWIIGASKPLIVTEYDLAANDFVPIERPGEET